MEKKYKTEPECGMLRIIALKDFSNVKKGDKGGLIEKEENLSQEGNCWVYDEATVSGNAWVSGDAVIADYACICGFAEVYGGASVRGQAFVGKNAQVFGEAEICGDAEVWDSAQIYGKAWINGVSIGGDAYVRGNIKLWATIKNYSHITTSIKDSSDYIILAIKKEFRVFSSNPKDKDEVLDDYIKNIQTIRQIYGKEIYNRGRF